MKRKTLAAVIAIAVLAATIACNNIAPEEKALRKKLGDFYDQCLTTLEQRVEMNNKLLYLYGSDGPTRQAMKDSHWFGRYLAGRHSAHYNKSAMWTKLFDEILNSPHCPQEADSKTPEQLQTEEQSTNKLNGTKQTSYFPQGVHRKLPSAAPA